jgi:hypothetical protein
VSGRPAPRAAAPNVDLARPHDFSLGPDAQGRGPRYFGAAPASFSAWQSGDFVGSVELGGSCNCSVLQLIPHCHGTHTECVGHLTRATLDAFDVLPLTLLPALLLTVSPVRAKDTRETTSPAPESGDMLITAQMLNAAAARLRSARPDAPAPQALLLRSLPNDELKRVRDYAAHPAAFLTRDAALWLVTSGIEHLVVDLPSIDRAHDAGLMTAHRIFFGLPNGSAQLGDSARPRATITELAYMDNAVADGPGLLLLQAARLPGDALPSRPMFYPLLAEIDT